jgi:hypothetical protein
MMRRSGFVAFAVAVLVSAGSAPAGGGTVGTMTVKGETTALTHGVALVQTDPDDESQSWLVILLSDVAVGEADRAPARLAELAAAGKVKAVRVLWKEGYDAVYATPYHLALSQSGRRGEEHPTLSLDRYDGKRFEGAVKSKMLGQEWFFQANLKAALTHGGVAEMEEQAAEEEPASGVVDEKTAKKRALGRMGYEYNLEMFERAIQENNVEAVRTFLALGMPANTSGEPYRQPLLLAVTQCAFGHEAEATEMAEALLAAGAKVDAGAKDGITPLLNAAQSCSKVEIVTMLLAAGANPNTRAPGGATPLMFAKLFGKKEMEEVLRSAGARD